MIPQLGPRDIWTPMSLPAVEGQNYYSAWPPDWLTARWPRYRDWAGKDSALHYRYFYDHMPIARIARMMPPKAFTGYTKFCFDRNPWDFVVSLYFYMRRKGDVAKWDFDRFLHEIPVPQNWQLYTRDGKVIVDRVFRYEDLQSSLKEIASFADIDFAGLTHDKRSYRPDAGYRSHYSQSSRDYVAEKWKPTIDLLGYDF